MRWWKIIFWATIGLIVVLTGFLALKSRVAKANPGTNISANSAEHFAWDDIDGWWDFYSTDSVTVRGSKMEGYASSSSGDMSLDCYTTRNGNICGTSNYGICNGPGPHNNDGTCPSSDATGQLTGYAWNDAIGWISFNCNQTSHGGSNTCAASNYYVQITGGTATSVFSGYAWNDTAGWISFNCSNGGSCGISNYKTVTSWIATSSLATLISSVFDTQLQSGGILNSILWTGEQPSNTCVKFQIATSSNSSGPWTYYGPGPSTLDYFGGTCPGPNYIIGITGTDRLWVNNTRYLRYKIFLTSDLTQTKTPVVEDVILNWSK